MAVRIAVFSAFVSHRLRSNCWRYAACTRYPQWIAILLFLSWRASMATCRGLSARGADFRGCTRCAAYWRGSSAHASGRDNRRNAVRKHIHLLGRSGRCGCYRCLCSSLLRFFTADLSVAVSHRCRAENRFAPRMVIGAWEFLADIGDLCRDIGSDGAHSNAWLGSLRRLSCFSIAFKWSNARSDFRVEHCLLRQTTTLLVCHLSFLSVDHGRHLRGVLQRADIRLSLARARGKSRGRILAPVSYERLPDGECCEGCRVGAQDALAQS